MKRAGRLIRDAWLIIGITLALLTVLEAGLMLALRIRGIWHTPSPDFRALADTYSDSSWAARYYHELDEVEKQEPMRWRSYVYWRRAPRVGEYINIDADGLRHTYSVGSPQDQQSRLKVFIFGGSTIWGLGAGDDTTIPSLFAKEVAQRGLLCHVVNYGQYAYVSTQGVIELILQLRQGNIPDAVIFYDGVNDTFGAFQLRVPGLPFDEARREMEFHLLKHARLPMLAAQFEIERLAIVRVLNGFLKRAGLRSDTVEFTPPQSAQPIHDRAALTGAVVDTYFNNIRVVQALADAYGFTAQFYWQPVIYLKPHLTEYERASLALDFNYEGMKEFYFDTWAQVPQTAMREFEGSFHNISQLFRDVRDPIYLDFNHMGERGNRIVAARMAEDFTRLAQMVPKIGTRPAIGRGVRPR